ncbi:TK/RTKC protein kinase [Salpingoeca rosetta]|uniref:TK/RTKC protein kinase n=1 Tax=Salpingoeca rosetta (strain ATCC 50818 / BSB-021) TaxID=946362 RepID=F2UPL1_SALR5|nr:TK/RTKC protein kinase [Salpingoeca rosetta]EGD79566.1 TK/RTKC protein kinase [Salpingoeca rosetta]|eukprot:XP_004988794.1 TK/RTKC protein kinase [Salpingoeca rosetta]
MQIYEIELRSAFSHAQEDNRTMAERIWQRRATRAELPRRQRSMSPLPALAVSSPVVAVIVVTALLASVAAATDWVKFDTHEYLLLAGKMTLNDGVTRCAELDGFVALPESDEENSFFLSLVKQHGLNGNGDIYFGATDQVNEGDFRSLVDNQPLVYNAWTGKQPDNFQNNEDCITYNGNNWNDIRCGPDRRIFCKRDALADRWIVKDNNEYLFSEDMQVSFDVARAFCAGYSAMLAEPRDLDEATFVARFSRHGPTDAIWLGLADVDGNGTYRWLSDGTQPQPYLFASGISAGQCGAVSSAVTTNNKLVTLTCDTPLPALCTRPFQVCPIGTYRDFFTGNCTACDQGTYQDTPAQYTCKSSKVFCLESGFGQSVPISATADRQCMQCEPGTHSTTTVLATTETIGVCASCNSGTYQDQPGQSSCKPQPTCNPGTYILREGASYARECRACDGVREYQDEPNQHECKAVKLCTAEEYEVEAPSPDSNRRCRSCELGVTFLDTAFQECRAVTACQAGTVEDEPPTLISDRSCRAETFTCKDGRENGDGDVCTCAIDNCQSCTKQPNSEEMYGAVLLQVNRHPQLSALVRPCQQLGPQADYVASCASECRNSTTCTAFWIAVSEAEEGLCCIYSSFSSIGSYDRRGGSFYALSQCDLCDEGHFKSGVGCRKLSVRPQVGMGVVDITLPLTATPGTRIGAVNATAEEGHGPLKFSLKETSDLFAVNGTTGAVMLLQSLTVASDISLTVLVTDTRDECFALNEDGTDVITNAGGCSTTVKLAIKIAVFIGCPSHQSIYLQPELNEENVTWTPPRLPGFFSSLVVRNNTPALPVALGEGVHTITYSAGPLNVGGYLLCEFDISLRYGFSILVESLGHVATGPLLQDFLLADNTIVDGVARPRRFRGDVVARPLAIGLVSKPGKPFTVFARNGVEGRIVVQLQWCTHGTLPATTSAFANGSVAVTLLQPSSKATAAALVFTDHGSGVTQDARCLRIAVESSHIRGTLSFAGIDMTFTHTSMANRTRRSSSPAPPSVTIRDYSPHGRNFVAVQFGNGDGSPLAEDSGPFLSQEDTIAPRWLNCPTAPIVAHAQPGQATAVATWEELVPVDNVEVVDVQSSHTSGDYFSVVHSPHTVTFTASDGQLSTTCAFDVEVTFDPITTAVVATTSAEFSVSHEVLPLLHTQTYTHYLVGGTNDTALATFRLDAKLVTAIKFVVLPPPGERFFVRTVPTADRGQLVVDLVFSLASTSPIDADALIYDDDAIVAYELGEFALDTTPAADGLDDNEQQDSLSPTGTITGARVHIDAAGGVVVVRGTAPDTFKRGFSFASLTLQVSFPLGRNFTSLADGSAAIDTGETSTTAVPPPPANTTAATTTTATLLNGTTMASAVTAPPTTAPAATGGGVHANATTSTTQPTSTAATTGGGGSDGNDDTGDGVFVTKPFAMQAGSFLGFKLSFAVDDADDHSGFLSLLDTQAPFFRRCPFSLHRDIDVVLATVPREPHAIANWTLPVVDDNRGRDQLTLTSNVPAGGVFALQAPGDAPYSVQYDVKDLTGNTATCDFFVAVRDFEAPRVVVVDDVVVTLPSAPYSPGHAVLATVTPEQVRAATNTTDNSGAFTWTAPATALSLGTGETDVMVEAEDEWGNKGSAVVRVRVLDTTPPTLFCNDPSPVVTPGVQAEAAVVNFTAPSYVDNVPTAATLTYSHAPGSLFPVGTTHVNVTATDASGNAALCVLAVEVIPFQAATAPDNSNIVAGASGGGAFLLVLLAVFAALYYRQRRRSRRPQNWDEIFEMIEQFKGRKDGSDGPVVPRELNRANIKLLEELGKGAFGIVYKGLLTEAPIPGYLVACKSLHAKATASERIELMEEAAVVAQFDHPNVLQLIGVVSVGKPVLVVLEFMEYGSLRSYVQDNDVDEATRLLFAGDCAEGLNHVHSKGFVHRDIAARNILVSSERRCKVADFGLARDTEESDYYRSRGGQLPVRWSAPEALEDRKFTRATDVWSFGILCHEIWTRGKMPYDGWGNQKVWVMVCDGYRLPKAETCRDVVYEQLLACWHAEAERRPSLADLAAFFRDEYEAYTGESLQPKDEYLAIGDTPHSGTKKPRRSLSGTLGTFLGGLRRRSSKDGNLVINPLYHDDEMADLAEDESEDREALQLYDMGDNGDDAAVCAGSERNGDAGRGEAMQLYDMGDGDGDDGAVARTEFTTNATSSRSQSDGDSDGEAEEQQGDDNADDTVTFTLDELEAVDDDTAFGFGDVNTDTDFAEDDCLQLYGNVDTQQPCTSDHGEGTCAITSKDLGRRVRVQGYECLGTIAFVGKHHAKGSDRVGVALDLPHGRNNGTVGGVTYFSCESNKGILCVPTKVSLVD